MPILDVSLRMADFGSFLASVADVEGWGAEANSMLDEMEDRQTEQAVGSNRIVALIRELFAKSKTHSAQSYTAKKWAEMLLPLVSDNDQETKKQLTSKFLNWAFTKVQTVRNTFRINDHWDGHQKVKLFTLTAEEILPTQTAIEESAFQSHGPVLASKAA